METRIRGSSFLDIVNEVNDAARYVDDQSFIGEIEKLFQQLIDKTIIKDFVEAWNIFKWLKIEKKAFNNIEWKRVYKLSELRNVSEFGVYVDTWIDGRPDSLNESTVKTQSDWLTPGFHFFEDGTCSYLELPLDPAIDYSNNKLSAQAYVLGVNEAIDLARPYLPSFLEIYATYVATGDMKLANEIYDYYVTSDECRMEVTVYQLLTVTEDKRGDERVDKVYRVKVDNGSWENLTEAQYNERVEQASKGQGLWAWLKDVISNFIEAIQKLVDDAINAVKSLLGLYYKVDSDYVGVVTKGYAYDYIINQSYTIKVEQGETERAPQAEGDRYETTKTTTYESTETRTKRVCGTERICARGQCYDVERCKDVTENINHTHELQAKVIAYYMRDITIWTDTLQYVSSSIEEYEEKTRYQWIFKKVVEENDWNYTEDDVAIAIDTINTFCSQTYGLNGGASARNFVLAGELNTSIITFGSQFDGKNLAYMMAVDDTGTFWQDEWCAMFVTYNMRKAGVPVAFSACGSFRRYCLKYDVPGFYDIVDNKCYAVRAGSVTRQPEHMGTYNEIQVRRYSII